jgi:uncharacterized membrane protein
MEYILYKLIHLIAVMIFLGNIILGLFWMHFAVNTKDVKIINHTILGIIKADQYFTIPGVIIITLGGLMAAMAGNYPIIRTGWIFWSIVMFTVSGIAFMIKVVPLQKKMYQFTINQEVFNWNEFYKLFKAWDFWGIVALISPIIAFVFMILKWPS